MKKLQLFPFVVLLFLVAISINCEAQERGIPDRPFIDSKYSIENCVNQFTMDKTVKTKVGYQYWFVDKDFLDGRTLKMSVVEPHEATHAPHKHAEDEIFFVLEGKAQFYLDGKTTTGGQYTSFYCPANVEHGISNIGDTELKYLVIKKYLKKEIN